MRRPVTRLGPWRPPSVQEWTYATVVQRFRALHPVLAEVHHPARHWGLDAPVDVLIRVPEAAGEGAAHQPGRLEGMDGRAARAHDIADWAHVMAQHNVQPRPRPGSCGMPQVGHASPSPHQRWHHGNTRPARMAREAGERAGPCAHLLRSMPGSVPTRMERTSFMRCRATNCRQPGGPLPSGASQGDR